MKSRRPAHLTPENAANFKQQGVVDVYHLRLPHPPSVFETLAGLIPDSGPRTVLDVGAGDGSIARQLVPYVDRVDAVDFSQAMIATGKRAPGGDNPKLNWIYGNVETVELNPPYGLITGGDSIHWMDWEVVFPRFHDLLVPDGQVAFIARYEQQPVWYEAMLTLIERYSVYRNFERYDTIEGLKKRELFAEAGRKLVGPVTHQQSVEDYIMSWHSRGGLAREGMSQADIEAFDDGLRDVVTPYADDGLLTLQTEGRVTWGRPLKP